MWNSYLLFGIENSENVSSVIRENEESIQILTETVEIQLILSVSYWLLWIPLFSQTLTWYYVFLDAASNFSSASTGASIRVQIYFSHYLRQEYETGNIICYSHILSRFGFSAIRGNTLNTNWFAYVRSTMIRWTAEAYVRFVHGLISLLLLIYVCHNERNLCTWRFAICIQWSCVMGVLSE